jgi:hypothetical protein
MGRERGLVGGTAGLGNREKDKVLSRENEQIQCVPILAASFGIGVNNFLTSRRDAVITKIVSCHGVCFAP